MAKVKITGHASGTGVFTITAPNSNTDRTITLPDASVTLGTDATKLPLAGGTMSGAIVLNSTNLTAGDSTSNANKIRMGASNDLNIHHDGSNSYIEDSGTGALRILGSSIELRNAPSDNELMLKATVDGSVELYHNNVKQLETTSVGVLVGATASPNSTNSGVQLANNGDGNNSCRSSSGSVTAFRHHFVFYNGNGGVGSISTNGSATAFNTSSDYRLKENVDYTWDATTRLKQLKPARFNFIADDTNTLVDGFIAHEVSSVVPEAISGEKDAVKMQGIDQSKLVPLLVKTIQELEARITALEA